MGRHFAEVLEGRTYRCRRCRTHLAKMDELVSTVRCRSALDDVPDKRPLFCAVCAAFHAFRRGVTSAWSLHAVRLALP